MRTNIVILGATKIYRVLNRKSVPPIPQDNYAKGGEEGEGVWAYTLLSSIFTNTQSTH